MYLVWELLKKKDDDDHYKKEEVTPSAITTMVAKTKHEEKKKTSARILEGNIQKKIVRQKIWGKRFWMSTLVRSLKIIHCTTR